MPRGIHKKMYAVEEEASIELLSGSTEATKFIPTPFMDKWIDFALRLQTDDISKIANECGIDRTNWYKWQKVPGFIDWYTATWNHRLRTVGAQLDMIGIMNSKKDYRYWEAMQRRVGNLQQNNNTNVAVQINTPPIVDANGQTLDL